MSREMAAPGARIRLTIEVLPLTADNVHGARRAQTLAAFKSRKFALPVQSEDTLETVWKQIEYRYKTNYLNTEQRAIFEIKKLQDAYDCDLDVGDTVSSIFEGETDPARRMIKVVPSMVNRDFSVPVTSNLRPGNAQKRGREIDDEHVNKRRRIEKQQLADIEEEPDPLRDQPVPTTESEREAEGVDEGGTNGARTRSRSRKSATGGSLVFVQNTQTGQAEFGLGVKEESPELGLPPPRPAARPTSVEQTFVEASLSIPRSSPHKQTPTQSLSRTSLPPPRKPSEPSETEIPQTEEDTVDIVPEQEDMLQDAPEAAATIHRSPQSSPPPSQQTRPLAATQRRNVYDVPSSPEFLQNGRKKTKMTYGRSPRTANTIQKEVDLLNRSRLVAAQTPSHKNKVSPRLLTSTKKAHAFHLPEYDEIESSQSAQATEALPRSSRGEDDHDTADLTSAFLEDAGRYLQDGVRTPTNSAKAKPRRPGSLKKPSKPAAIATPSSTKRGAHIDSAASSSRMEQRTSHGPTKSVPSTPGSNGSKSGVVAPHIQEMLDRLKVRQSQRKSSPKVVIPSRRSSTQSDAGLAPVAEGPLTNGVITRRRESALGHQSKVPSIEPTSVEPAATITNDTARVSVQPPPSKTTPVRSPVPLPKNVRHLARKGTPADAQGSGPKDDEVFKKPAVKNPLSTSQEQSNGDSSQRRELQSSNTRSTPRSSQAPAQSPVHISPETGASGSPVPHNTIDIVRSPQSPSTDVRRLSITSSTRRLLQPGTGAAKEDSSMTPTSAPQKRGWPKKSASLESYANIESASDARPIADAEDRIPPTQRHNTDGADDAIVISSVEPSSSDDSDHSEVERDQHATGPLKNGNVEQSAPEVGSDGVHKPIDTQLEQDQQPWHNTEVGKQANGYVTSTDQPDKGAVAGSDSTIITKPLSNQFTDSTTAEQAMQGKNGTAPETTSRMPELWSFANIARSASTTNEGVEELLPGDRAKSTPEVPEATVESESSTEEASEDARSRSASAALSTRSSPAVTRQPARFLSHSPTPDGSDSEEESDKTSAAPSKAQTPPETEPPEQSESDSSSETGSSDTEDEDEEMPDAPIHPVPNSTADGPAQPIPSSPPQSPSASTPRIPETSQPSLSQLPRKTPVPLPPNSQPRSSQSVSVRAAGHRPAVRHAAFRTLREQLQEAKTKPITAQKQTFDPRTINLSKLAAKGKSAVGIGLGNDDSSDEDDEDSSDSSDSD